MSVKQCEYCGDVLVVAASATQEPAQVPVTLRVTEGVLIGKYEFDTVNCLAFWVEERINRD